MSIEGRCPDATGSILPIADAGRAWRAIRGLLGPHRLLLVGTVLVLLTSGTALLLVPPLLGAMVDTVLQRGTVGVLDGLAWAVLAALGARAVLAALGGVLVARLGEQVLAQLRERVVRSALRVRLAVVERADPGDLLQRVGGDIAVIADGIRGSIPVVVVALLDVVLTVVGLGVIDWRLALAGLAPLPVWVLATRWYLRLSGPRYAAERVAEARRTQSLLATIGGAATARAHRLTTVLLGRVEGDSAAAVRASLSAMTAQSRFGAVMNAAELIGVLAVVGTGFALVRTDEVSVGAATAAALYFLRLFDPIGILLFLLDETQSAGAALARLVGVLDLPPLPAPVDPAMPQDAGVRVSGVRHTYPGGPEVLHGIDLVIAPGERVAVVGASGAGKSTLGAVLAGMAVPTAGRVEIGGVALDRLAAPRRHVALITQEVHVFAGTVGDNLRLARPGATDAELGAALAAIGAPFGVHDPVDGSGGTGPGTGTVDPSTTAAGSPDPDGRSPVPADPAVSDPAAPDPAAPDPVASHPAPGATAAIDATGAQLLALARLWLADPAVAVLDEATAEAGSAGARTLERAAEAVLAGRTAVVVAHRLTQAAAADRVVVLDAGRVVEDGRHADLVAAGGRYAQLWSAWSAPRP